MIRFRRLTPALLDAWLVAQPVQSPHRSYRLRLWRGSHSGLSAIRGELLAYIDEALEDTRRRIRRGFEDDLSPFNDPKRDPAANYPALLHRVTLQGYFGETLAVIAVEHWGAHDRADWKVPSFLFRLHDQEFQHLEAINERLLAGEGYTPDREAELRPGRTGDDGLAFRMNTENTITDVLTLEAKCLARSHPAKIEEAHKKLAAGGLRPSGIRELINLLAEYDTGEAQVWLAALLGLWKDGYRFAKRHHAIAYTCGQIPRQTPGRLAWMPTDAPHPAYPSDGNLEGMEFQFEDLGMIIDSLYRDA